MADVDFRKREIRQAVRERRATLSEDQRAKARDALTIRLIELVEARGAESVSCYWPVAGEPDTTGFIEWIRDQQIEVLFPSARADGLLDWIKPSWDGVVAGLFGISEPLGTFVSPLAVSDVDLMIIPACSVDHNGVRLGWGRGYFDKTLGSMDRQPPVFAVVYNSEFAEELPSDIHDMPVTGVVTPEGITYLDNMS